MSASTSRPTSRRSGASHPATPPSATAPSGRAAAPAPRAAARGTTRGGTTAPPSPRGAKAARRARHATPDPRQLALPLVELAAPVVAAPAAAPVAPARRTRVPAPKRPIPPTPDLAVAAAEAMLAARCEQEDPTPALLSSPDAEGDSDPAEGEAHEAPPEELLTEEAVQAIIRESERMIRAAPSGTSGSFSLYLHDLQQYPVLSPAQEFRLAGLARRGSAEAKDALIRHNLRFVITIARKHTAHGVALEDLVQEGNVGLMRAVQKFNETRGVRFVSYAVWWIQQAVRAALASQQRAVRLPINRATQLARVHRTMTELTRRLGRAPTHAEIGAVAGIPAAMVQTLLNVAQTELSLDAPHPGDPDSGLALGERIGAPESLERSIERRSRTEAMAAVLRTLRRRDEQILRFCYGLDGGREYTLEEIGLVFGITRERVRQIRDRAIKELRTKGHAEVLRDYWHDDLADD